MSLLMSNDRIKITNRNEETVFDTQHKMPVITQSIVGSITLAAGTHYLGKIDPSSNFIYPVYRYLNGSQANSYEIGLCSRLYRVGFARVPTGNGAFVDTTSFSAFTFYISGGGLYLGCLVNGGGFDGVSIQYRVMVGSVL